MYNLQAKTELGSIKSFCQSVSQAFHGARKLEKIKLSGQILHLESQVVPRITLAGNSSPLMITTHIQNLFFCLLLGAQTSSKVFSNNSKEINALPLPYQTRPVLHRTASSPLIELRGE